jgi:hypothetical protein
MAGKVQLFLVNLRTIARELDRLCHFDDHAETVVCCSIPRPERLTDDEKQNAGQKTSNRVSWPAFLPKSLPFCSR